MRREAASGAEPRRAGGDDRPRARPVFDVATTHLMQWWTLVFLLTLTPVTIIEADPRRAVGAAILMTLRRIWGEATALFVRARGFGWVDALIDTDSGFTKVSSFGGSTEQLVYLKSSISCSSRCSAGRFEYEGAGGAEYPCAGCTSTGTPPGMGRSE